MANEYRDNDSGYGGMRGNRSRDYRQEDAGYNPERYRQQYENYGGFRSDYGNEYNTGDTTRNDYGDYRHYDRRSADPEPYGRGGGFGSGSGRFGGDFGSSGYMGSGYGRDVDYGRRRGGGLDQYKRAYDDYGDSRDRNSYSSDYGYQRRNSRGVGFNRPDYASGFRNYKERHFGNYDRNMNRMDDRDWMDKATDEFASWFGDRGARERRRMDERQSHRGKGPKGYRRSDDRIREDINDRLSDDPWVDASDIEVIVSNCEVTLAGNVRDRNTRRRAEDIAESVSGVSHVENRIRVQREEEGSFAREGYSTGTQTGNNAATATTANGKGKSAASRN